MDPDFADFLLDESHLDLRQKKIDDAEFLEGLKISNDEEEEFLLTVDFEPSEARTKILDENSFDMPFEITAEELDLLEAQEKALSKGPETKSFHTPKKQANRRKSSLTGNKDSFLPASIGNAEIEKLKADLGIYKDRSESLESELSHQKRQILTKEGEITILRQRLNQLDNEKLLMAQKYAQLTESNRKTAEKLESKWVKELETLKSELLFKEQELLSLSTSVRRKLPKGTGSSFLNETSINSLGFIKPATITKDNSDSEIAKNSTVVDKRFEPKNDLEIFTHYIQVIDLDWNFTEMKEFDIIDIVKAREFATNEIRNFMINNNNNENANGKALAHGLVKFFDRALYYRQPKLLTYMSHLFALILDDYGDRIFEGLICIKDSDCDSIQFFNQITKLLTGKVIIDGIPKEIIMHQLFIINVIIFLNDMKIPEELKPIINKGVLQWILRYDGFEVSEFEHIAVTLYSTSCDLSMLSSVFLSSTSDKIEFMSVLDLLLSRTENLMKTLFPNGKIYKSRFGSQLPLLEDELDRLRKLDALLSLLYSFVHRSLGPSTLWMPENLIIAQTIENSEFLPPNILLAQEDLLDTIFKGLAAAWNGKDIFMADVLKTARIPLLHVCQMISTHKSSFGAAVESAVVLEKIINREVADDVKSVYETGKLAKVKQSPAPAT